MIRTLLRDLPVFAGDLPAFDTDAAPPAPEALFTAWLTAAVAAGVPEPHAATLSTIGADGDPAARVLILKELDERGWHVASHAGSPKGRDLARHPAAALTFHWPAQGRQVRVRGPVTAAEPEAGAADFRARSVSARAEASLGRQSRPLGDPAERNRAAAEALRRFQEEPGLVVPEWTVYVLRAAEVEFWQADRARRHVRLHYRRTGAGWHRDRLHP